MQHMMCWECSGKYSNSSSPAGGFSKSSSLFVDFRPFWRISWNSMLQVYLSTTSIRHEMGCWLPYMGMFCSTILCNNQCNSNLFWKAFVLPPTSPKNPILYDFICMVAAFLEDNSFLHRSHYDHRLDSPSRAARQSLLQQSQLSQSAFFEAKVGGGWCPCWWLVVGCKMVSTQMMRIYEKHDSCVFMKVTIMTISVVVLVHMMTSILIMTCFFSLAPLKSYL